MSERKLVTFYYEFIIHFGVFQGREFPRERRRYARLDYFGPIKHQMATNAALITITAAIVEASFDLGTINSFDFRMAFEGLEAFGT